MAGGSHTEARDIAFRVYEKKCSACGLDDEKILEVHHIDGNDSNNASDNLLIVCPTCHAKIEKKIWLVLAGRKIVPADLSAGLFDIAPAAEQPPVPVIELIENFSRTVKCLEKDSATPYYLYQDGKSKAYYIECHISAEDAPDLFDLDAAIDPDEQEEYRINREEEVDHPAFAQMIEDAAQGRQFSDIVSEWNTTYREDRPLKILGGQHRCEAIKSAKSQNPERFHGFRIYLGLTKEQRVDISKVSNTNIAVSPDLLDRMQESLLGPELRNWCQKTGLLEEAQDFADRRRTDGLITVRLARMLVVNYIKGFEFKGDPENDIFEPYLIKQGAKIDPLYESIVKNKKEIWSDESFQNMGAAFAQLHKQQHLLCSQDEILRKKYEFRNKALTPAVLSSWAFIAGLLQKDKSSLKTHHSLPQDKRTSVDPLNVDSMTKARHKKDPDNYRGLGTRSDAKERGRLAELFYLHSKMDYRGKGLPKEVLDLAIQTYETKIANKEKKEAEKRAKEVRKQ